MDILNSMSRFRFAVEFYRDAIRFALTDRQSVFLTLERGIDRRTNVESEIDRQQNLLVCLRASELPSRSIDQTKDCTGSRV